MGIVGVCPVGTFGQVSDEVAKFFMAGRVLNTIGREEPRFLARTTPMSQPPPTIEQNLRDKLLDAIAFRIGVEVEDAMPSDISKDTRRAILAEVLPAFRFTLSHLNTDELQDERHIERQIQSALRIGNGFVDRIRKQRSRS
jgi:hypothetical protein